VRVAAGSIVSNILLVLGVALIFGGNGGSGAARPLLDDAPAPLVLVAVLLFLVPSVPVGTVTSSGTARVLSIPCLDRASLPVRGDGLGLRRHKRLHQESGDTPGEGWSLAVALTVLAAATVVTALISETLVHSLASFAESAGLSSLHRDGDRRDRRNVAEHGGAVVIASRGSCRSQRRSRCLRARRSRCW
jgi:Ca2+/H+ antiporter